MKHEKMEREVLGKRTEKAQSATEMGFIKDRHSGWRERGVGEKGEAWAPPYRELRGRSELGASEATGRDSPIPGLASA